MRSIDSFPTDRINDIEYRVGRVLPFGASIVEGGVNFSIFSKEATGCTLLLFHYCTINGGPSCQVTDVACPEYDQ